jgi:antitoxin component YwqK of YwqJK toxin-antitoxin module
VTLGWGMLFAVAAPEGGRKARRSPEPARSRAVAPGGGGRGRVTPMHGGRVRGITYGMLTWLQVALVVAGSNSTEGGLERTKEELQVKLEVLCDVKLAIRWDHASLARHNKDIGWDQTDGALECNEPLRYLWALCRTAEGKALVRKRGLREVVCRGTPGAVGSLTVTDGVITVERAYEERQSAERAKRQFEAALKTSVAVEPDPYSDETWNAFRREPAPVLSTTDYCLIGGQKVAFDWSAADRAEVLNRDLPVKCLEAGVVVIDVKVKDRKPTGLLTDVRDDWRRRYFVVDGRYDGPEETSTGGRVMERAFWKQGERVWAKALHENGALKRYWRQLPKEQVVLELGDDGRVSELVCSPDAKDDEVLRGWCGFSGEKTTEVYDGTKVVNRTVTFKKGQLTKQVAGTSEYASRSTATFVDGQLDGEERLTRRDGTLEQSITWKQGVKHGPERRFAKDGKKVVEEQTWRDGQLERRVEYFLNGKRKLEEVYVGRAQRQRTAYFDLGAVSETGAWVRCERPWGDPWCEDGVHTSFFESGQKATEVRWRRGAQLSGRQWYPSGALEEVSTWTDGKLSARTGYFEDGGVALDEAYEEDGSRKVK